MAVCARRGLHVAMAQQALHAMSDAEPAQDAHDRAAPRSVRSESALEHPGDLVRAPARMLIAQRENRENDVLTGATRARVGPPALLDQAKRTKLPIAPQPLVARLPRDSELLAKRREIAAFLRRSLDELKFQTHGALLFPGHPSFEYRQRCPDTFVSAMSWYSTNLGLRNGEEWGSSGRRVEAVKRKVVA